MPILLILVLRLSRLASGNSSKRALMPFWLVSACSLNSSKFSAQSYPGVSHLPKEFWFLPVENVLQNQDLGGECIHCPWGINGPRPSQWICMVRYACIYTDIHTYASILHLCDELNWTIVVLAVESLSCVQLFCNPEDCSLPESSVHGISLEGILE